jgi:hypothetical protein
MGISSSLSPSSSSSSSTSLHTVPSSSEASMSSSYGGGEGLTGGSWWKTQAASKAFRLSWMTVMASLGLSLTVPNQQVRTRSWRLKKKFTLRLRKHFPRPTFFFSMPPSRTGSRSLSHRIANYRFRWWFYAFRGLYAASSRQRSPHHLTISSTRRNGGLSRCSGSPGGWALIGSSDYTTVPKDNYQ